MELKTKVCQICGEEYQPTGRGQKYCVGCSPAVYAEEKTRWYKANPEKNRARTALYRKANPEKCRLSVAAWAKANPEKEKDRYAKWRRANPEKTAFSVEKHRAAKHANTSPEEMLTSTEWLAILAEANGHCHYCGKEAKLTLDHVIPLSKGGKHSKDNVVPACEHCNKSKGNKTLEEWDPCPLVR